MKIIISLSENATDNDLDEAIKVAKTWNRFYNTPDWERKKVGFKPFTVHESKRGTIIVNKENPK